MGSIVHGVTKSLTWLSTRTHTHIHTFKSLIHLNSFSVSGVNRVQFHPSAVVIQFSQHHFLKRLSSSHCMFMAPLSNSSWIHMYSLFLGSLSQGHTVWEPGFEPKPCSPRATLRTELSLQTCDMDGKCPSHLYPPAGSGWSRGPLSPKPFLAFPSEWPAPLGLPW